MRRTAFLLVVVTTAALAAAGCYLFPKEEKVLVPPILATPTETFTTVTAKRGTIDSRLIVGGDFVSLSQTPLYFKVGGSRLKRIAVKLGDAVGPGTLVAELDTGPLQNRIAQQKVMLRKAQVVSERAVILGRDRFEKELASLDVELATLELKVLIDQMEEAQLLAPVAGEVTYVASVHPGDLVDGYLTIVQVADPRDIQLVYRGDEAGSFVIGMAVTVELSDGKRLSGKVIMAPGSVPADVTADLRGAVIVRVDGLPSGVRRGHAARITRILAHRENVIVIPRDLVRTYLSRDFVRVLANGQITEKTVEVGVRTFTEVEIVSGLDEGDQILSQ